MLRKNWKTVFLIFLLMLYMVGCEMECYNPAGPDVPDPDIVKYFDFIVEYHRPAGSIIDSNGFDPIRCNFVITYYSSGNQDKRNEVLFTKVNGYLFVGELNQVPCSSNYDTDRVYDFFVADGKRQYWDYASTPIYFGDIFVLENKQTGIRYQLNNVIKMLYYNNLEDTMARCRIIHDGSVISKLSQLADVE